MPSSRTGQTGWRMPQDFTERGRGRGCGGLASGAGWGTWGRQVGESSELSLGCCYRRFSSPHPRSVSSFQSCELRGRKISAHSWCQKQHFLFPKVDCKSGTFIFVICHLPVLLMRLVTIYAGSARTQGLRSFLFISPFFLRVEREKPGYSN